MHFQYGWKVFRIFIEEIFRRVTRNKFVTQSQNACSTKGSRKCVDKSTHSGTLASRFSCIVTGRRVKVWVRGDYWDRLQRPRPLWRKLFSPAKAAADVTLDRYIAEDQVYLYFSPGHLWLHENRLAKVTLWLLPTWDSCRSHELAEPRGGVFEQGVALRRVPLAPHVQDDALDGVPLRGLRRLRFQTVFAEEKFTSFSCYNYLF